MPTDSLAAALASGADNNVNPLLLQYTPELQLAQGMMQQGVSTAPAYATQALARALTGAIGAGIQRSTTSDLAKAIGNSVTNAADLFPEGSVPYKLGHSKDPMLQMQLWNNLPAIVKLQSQNLNLHPNELSAMPGARQPSATGSPALGGAAAGEEAKARAPYEGGGDVTVQTPTGPQQIPATAATRAAIQPSVRPAISMPPPEPKPGLPTSPGAIPGTNVSGKPLANPGIESLEKIDSDELKMDREAASKGAQDMATIKTIHDFLPKVATGWSAETKLEGARILKAAGVPDDKINELMKTDVASGQLLQKKFLELSAGAARGMGAREPGSVIQLFGKTYSNLGTDPQAVVLQTNALYMDRLRTQRLAEAKTNYLNDSVNGVQSTGKYRGLKGFNEEFNKTNSAEAYLSAAEAMSGRGEPWARVKTLPEQNAIVRLIPSGSNYMAPDGKIHTMQ